VVGNADFFSFGASANSEPGNDIGKKKESFEVDKNRALFWKEDTPWQQVV
jgi:hypothetical protein